jgi:hypothetical protein
VARQSSEPDAVDDVDESPELFDELDSALPSELLPPGAESPALAPDPEPALAFVRLPLVDERSFLAQPEPLKWIAGVAKARRIVPVWPQLGHTSGPEALIPWITSTRCLQFEQT